MWKIAYREYIAAANKAIKEVAVDTISTGSSVSGLVLLRSNALMSRVLQGSGISSAICGNAATKYGYWLKAFKYSPRSIVERAASAESFTSIKLVLGKPSLESRGHRVALLAGEVRALFSL